MMLMLFTFAIGIASKFGVLSVIGSACGMGATFTVGEVVTRKGRPGTTRYQVTFPKLNLARAWREMTPEKALSKVTSFFRGSGHAIPAGAQASVEAIPGTYIMLAGESTKPSRSAKRTGVKVVKKDKPESLQTGVADSLPDASI